MGLFKKFFGDAIDGIKDRIDDIKDEVQDRIDSIKDEVQDRIDNIKDEVQGRLGDFNNEVGGEKKSTSAMLSQANKAKEEDDIKIQLGQFLDGVLTIREGIDELDDESLEDYKRLRKIVLPASLTKLDSDVICDQDELEEVDFSKVTKLTEIPDEFIYGNHKIQQFVIPEGVKTVGDGFLGEAKAGAEIYVPASVKKLGYISGNSNNDLIVYLYAENIDLDDVEEDIKTLYVLPQYYGHYAKKLKDCDSEAQLREMPVEKINVYKVNVKEAPLSEKVKEQAPKEAPIPETVLVQETKVEESAQQPISEQIAESSGSGLFSARLEAMIAAALQDGVLTEKERELLKRRVEKEGEDWDEVEMIIEARLAEIQQEKGIVAPLMEQKTQQEPEPEPKEKEEIIHEEEEKEEPEEEEENENENEEEESDSDVFEKDYDLEKIVLPASLEEIGERAFDSYENLRVADMSKCTKVETIGESAFTNLEKLETIILPPNLKTIGDYAFNGCINLKSIDFSHCPKLEYIGEQAFFYLPLTLVDLSATSLKFIGENAFASNEQLSSVKLPNTLVEIGPRAFTGTSLKEIVIPDSVEHIGSKAFADNEQLCAATIGRSAKDYFYEHKYPNGPIFEKTPNLKELTFRSEVAEYTGAKTLTKVTFCDTVKEIGKWACAECAELEEVVLPNSVTKIGYGAFAACESLSSIELPDSIAEIAESAFARTRLKEIVFPRELRKLEPLGEGHEKLRKLDFSKVTKLKVIPENFIGDDIPKLRELVLPMGVKNIEECIGGENLDRIFLPPTIKEVEDLHQVNLDIYCYAPIIEELGMMIESIEDAEDACTLYVLPEYVESYKAQRAAEDISEDLLIIDVIPEEFRYYYDN